MTNAVSTDLQVNNGREITKGVILSTIGFGLVVFDPSMILNLALAVISVPFLMIAPTSFSTFFSNTLQKPQYKTIGTIMLVASVLLLPLFLVIGLKVLALSLFAASFGVYTHINKNKRIETNIQAALRPQYVSKENNSNRYSSASYPQGSNAKHNQKKEEPTVQFPLVSHKIAMHLAQLLSPEDLKLLQQLINEVNKSYSYLPYLEEHHEYLATSVRELITDVAVNSIMRLNDMAKSCVRHGQVDATAKALFADNHQEHVNQLFHNQQDEIIDLNATILEKKMAGFATVGTEIEKKFRDELMELRILLKWFVAQAPDDMACSYEIISRKLEEETLKQMDEVFYKHDTTDEQREQLLTQLDELLAHFQSQSPLAEHHDQNDLLMLTNDPNTLYQNETQSFIDFNKQYVKQLKEHW